jgi:hypothetical protein
LLFYGSQGTALEIHIFKVRSAVAIIIACSRPKILGKGCLFDGGGRKNSVFLTPKRCSALVPKKRIVNVTKARIRRHSDTGKKRQHAQHLHGAALYVLPS